jgi:hypothetical protein
MNFAFNPVIFFFAKGQTAISDNKQANSCLNDDSIRKFAQSVETNWHTHGCFAIVGQWERRNTEAIKFLSLGVEFN